MTHEQQVDKKHYSFGAYGFEGRFVSYYWQLKKVLELKPQSVLEVGVGDKVFGNFIKENTGVAYTSVDIATDLRPDVVGSVTELPFGDNSFDIVCAFEVLEHLPFEQFEQAVSELSRVAKKYVILSMPHFGPMFSFSLKIPLFPLLQFSIKVPFPKKHTFNDQHYWEIGKQGYPGSLIKEKIRRKAHLREDFIPFNSPYHHFFVLEIKK